MPNTKLNKLDNKNESESKVMNKTILRLVVISIYTLDLVYHSQVLGI